MANCAIQIVFIHGWVVTDYIKMGLRNQMTNNRNSNQPGLPLKICIYILLHLNYNALLKLHF